MNIKNLFIGILAVILLVTFFQVLKRPSSGTDGVLDGSNRNQESQVINPASQDDFIIHSTPVSEEELEEQREISAQKRRRNMNRGAEYVSVKKDNVNIRTGPSTDNPVSMELFAGYPLKVIEKQGDWYKVSDFENDTGWIHTNLVTKGNTVILNAKESVSMRSGPSTKSSIVAVIERGVVLARGCVKDKWLQVKHNSGTVGWVYGPLMWPRYSNTSERWPCFKEESLYIKKESCYSLGKRYGRCGAAAYLGKSCDPADDVVIPGRCRNNSDTEDGIAAGMKEGMR